MPPRSTLRRRSRRSTGCSSRAAGARLEAAAAGPCRRSCSRKPSSCRLAGRRHLAGPRSRRADGRDRDRGRRLAAARRARARQPVRLVAGDARLPRHRHRALAGVPRRPRSQSNPAAHRNALIRLEAARLRRNPPPGPVIAAGSTGSIPATAELLAAIARLPIGAVVLPGLDRALDERAWSALAAETPRPAVLGHPQYGLAKLLRRIGLTRADVAEIGAATPALSLRAALVVGGAAAGRDHRRLGANAVPPCRTPTSPRRCRGVTLVEAPRERDEARRHRHRAARGGRRARPHAPRWSPATANSRAASPPNCCASASAPTIPAARRSPARRRRRC